MKTEKLFNWQTECPKCGNIFKEGAGLNIHRFKARNNEIFLKKFRNERNIKIDKEEILHLS